MKQRDHKAAHARRKLKYHRMGIDIPLEQWQSLTPEQQKSLSQKVREVIKEELSGESKRYK